MKNKIIYLIFFLFLSNELLAKNLLIQAKDITLDKNKDTSIFKSNVYIKTNENNTIVSDYAEYNRKENYIILKGNIIATDNQNNIIKTNYAEYNDNSKIFKTKGETNINTTENYLIEGKDIILDDKNKNIKSDKSAIITDIDNNLIYLSNFEYLSNTNILKSVGLVKIKDSMKNEYKFSQIYIDTKKKEILGTDIKAFFNDKSFKINEKNKPRIFANSIQMDKEFGKFKKSNFTLCNYRKDDKCPPWTIQASELLHDKKKKTIYYEHAVIKVYDVPLFYLPRLSHPDPTVSRRSGFLAPSFSDSKNLGSGLSMPYFWAINDDKNFTLNSKFYVNENPLFFGEYHQAFKNSNLQVDFGYTEGYKNTSTTKNAGEKSHFFSQFTKIFQDKDDSTNTLNVSIQEVSNDKYLKLYKIRSNLVDYNSDTLESGFNFTHEKDDMFFGINASIYETLKENYEDKYEYILPEITFDKNLYNSDKLGNFELQSNLKIHSYDTNKQSTFLVNDIDWTSRALISNNYIKNKFLGNIKNINYETRNINEYKNSTTSELYGAIGLSSQLDLEKKSGNSDHFFTPKMLVRYAPGSMRKEENGFRLDPSRAFSLDRLDDINNFETGISSTVGFDYKIKNKLNNFDFSVAQIINEKENKKMNSKTGLDEKISDLVGNANFSREKFNLNYNFALDQNYEELNYNEIGLNMDLGAINFDFDYLNEKKHIGKNDYFKTKLNLNNKDKGLLSFETKRNLITNSSEYYNLSYEYINDCLRAGLVYRREFYNDSELEPENSLIFKITLSPFGNINSPSFSQ
tara:strand:+ start:6738 stop:9134 length:2397 start_codon:yes stop_codon:yes gene_type:complete